MKQASKYWTRKHSQAAQKEGWDLFTRSDGLLEIERIDEQPTFKSDKAALEYVYRRAGKGSQLHLLAIHLDRRHVDNETSVPSSIARFSN